VSFAVEGTTAGELRTQMVRLLYDQVDRADATEIDTVNVISVVEEMRQSLDALSRQLSGYTSQELRAVSPLALQDTLDRLFASSGQAAP
jgi:hypothetical protein